MVTSSRRNSFGFPDSREEAKEYDKFAIGIYKDKGHRALVGHIPIEISSLCFHILNQHPSHQINAVVTGKREREVGLVVPAKFSFVMSNKMYAEFLEKELQKRQENFPTLTLKFKKKGIYRKFPIYMKYDKRT